jgi:short-subunit dehydrogenase
MKTELGESLVIIEADLEDPDRAKEVVDEAHRQLGGLSLVIANAGGGLPKAATKLRVDHILSTLRVNVLGACTTLTAAIPHMLEKGEGHLVGISSIAGYRGLPTSAAYSASKAALSTFLESIRVDLKGSGIYVTDIRPGFIATPATAKNKFKMPFLLESDEAARRILSAVEKRRSVETFPWQMALGIRLVRALPNWLYDRVAGKAS